MCLAKKNACKEQGKRSATPLWINVTGPAKQPPQTAATRFACQRLPPHSYAAKTYSVISGMGYIPVRRCFSLSPSEGERVG